MNTCSSEQINLFAIILSMCSRIPGTNIFQLVFTRYFSLGHSSALFDSLSAWSAWNWKKSLLAQHTFYCKMNELKKILSNLEDRRPNFFITGNILERRCSVAFAWERSSSRIWNSVEQLRVLKHTGARQDSRGRLGRGNNMQTAPNLKILETDGPTESAPVYIFHRKQ